MKDEIKAGIILSRSDDEVATNIRSYLVAKDGNKIIGCLALHIYSEELAEFRSMIVHKDYRGKGVGKKLINYELKNAKKLNLKKVLVLTYQLRFFQGLNFLEIPKSEIPDNKIWADCIKCKHFSMCDEIALIKEVE